MIVSLFTVNRRYVHFYAFGYVVKNNFWDVNMMVGAFYHKLGGHGNHAVIDGYLTRNVTVLFNPVHFQFAYRGYREGAVFGYINMLLYLTLKSGFGVFVALHIV